jgi:ElaB/YqjD/DUF883 family membrane-anchored ribosome-binding protein
MAGQGGMADELRSDAQELGSSAKDRIHSEAEAGKSTAAAQAKTVSSAMERTAGELDNEAPQWLKSALRKGASQIQRFADTIEQKDSREILSDVRTFARDNPATFLAACAAAGFAGARVFRAGGSEESSQFRSQTQGPPPQVHEPTFGSTGASMSANQTTGGEFV